MKRFLTLLGCVGATALVAVTFAPRAGDAASGDFYEQLSVNEPVVYGTLAVYTVSLAGGGEKLGDLLTLEEAMATGKFIIREIEEGAQVNTLEVSNKTGKNVILFAGEMVRGAKQDRIMSGDVVIPPGEKLNVDAFCVEAGRWTEVSDKFSYNNEVAPASVRATAQGKNDQGEVWAAVSKVNADAKTVTESDALTATYNDEKFQDERKNYEKAYKALAADKDVVGVIVATDGKVVAGDIFAGHDLFAKMWPRLLSSYVMDATLSPGVGGLISPATIKMRLAALDEAQKEETYKGDNQNRKTVNAADSSAYEFEYDGKKVHANIY